MEASYLAFAVNIRPLHLLLDRKSIDSGFLEFDLDVSILQLSEKLQVDLSFGRILAVSL